LHRLHPRLMPWALVAKKTKKKKEKKKKNNNTV
jgi:hypothetical protein